MTRMLDRCPDDDGYAYGVGFRPTWIQLARGVRAGRHDTRSAT